MIILDIDLDAFVSPVVYFQRDTAPRPADVAHDVMSEAEVLEFLASQCRLKPQTPGLALEHHVEVLENVAKLIENGRLCPPFSWVHIDAHDDLWGHYSRPPNSANFLYHCIKQNWLEKLTMVFPAKVFDFPAYVFHEHPPRIAFENYSVPLEFSDIQKFQAKKPPDFVLLARSPAFAPAKADSLYDFIRSCFVSVQ